MKTCVDLSGRSSGHKTILTALIDSVHVLVELHQLLLVFPDVGLDPQQDPQVPAVLLQVCDTVSIRHVHQHLFGRSELVSGHTNGAQMLAAL